MYGFILLPCLTCAIARTLHSEAFPLSMLSVISLTKHTTLSDNAHLPHWSPWLQSHWTKPKYLQTYSSISLTINGVTVVPLNQLLHPYIYLFHGYCKSAPCNSSIVGKPLLTSVCPYSWLFLQILVKMLQNNVVRTWYVYANIFNNSLLIFLFFLYLAFFSLK